MIYCHSGDMEPDRISHDPVHRSVRAAAVPERGDVAVAAKEATAVAFSCMLYSQGLFLGWKEAAL